MIKYLNRYVKSNTYLLFFLMTKGNFDFSRICKFETSAPSSAICKKLKKKLTNYIVIHNFNYCTRDRLKKM